MLDTNTVSYLVKGHPSVVERFEATDPAAICISAITHAELLYGLARRPEATRLAMLVHRFLAAVEIEPWDCGGDYAELRAHNEGKGISMADLDMLIAAHASNLGAVLVTADGVFRHVAGVLCENWTQ